LIKHADFIAYYTAAKLVVGGQGKELYDLSAQATTQIPLVGPGHGLLAFVNPPFLALILSPLGYLPYTVAYTAWIAIMLLAIVAGIWLLVAAAGFRGINAWLVGAVAITSVSVIVTLIQGQSTALVLLGLGLAYWAWRKEKMTLVGVALALTLFKPHLVLLIPGLLVVRKEWRALLAFMITAAVLVGVSALVLGGGVWLDYLRLVGPQAAGTAQHWASGTETQFGLIGILTTIGLSQAWGLVVCAIVGLGVLAKIATRPGQLALDFALVVVASFVIAPHANFHDTLVLLAAGVVVAGVLAHDKRA
jgi:hypothetical protein